MAKNAKQIANAFEQGSGIDAGTIMLIFIAVSIGIVAVFTIYLLFKKANNKGAEFADVFITLKLCVVTLCILILISTIVTI